MESPASNNLSSLQLKLIRTFEYLRNEKQLTEIDSLINFYFKRELDEAIVKAETEKNYTAAIYEEWLNENNRKSNQ